MNTQQLNTHLQARLNSANFTWKVSELNAANLTDFAAKAFPQGTIRLNGANLATAGDSIRLTGKATDGPFKDMAMEFQFSIVNTEPAFTFEATTSSNWNIKSSFPRLEYTLYDTIFFKTSQPPKFRATTHPTSGPKAGQFAPEIHLEGSIDLSAMSGGLTTFLGLPDIPVKGGIELEDGGKLKRLDLKTRLDRSNNPVNLGIGTMDHLDLIFGSEYWFNPAMKEIQVIPHLEIKTALDFKAQGKTHEIPLSVEIRHPNRKLTFIAELGGVVEASLDEIAALVKQSNFADHLPDFNKFELSKVLGLTRLFLDINPSDFSLERIRLSINSRKSWTPFHFRKSGMPVTLEEVEMDVLIFDPFSKPYFWVTVMGDVAVGNAGVIRFAGRYPDWNFQAYIKDDTVFHLDEALNNFIGDGSAIPKIELSDFGIDYFMKLKRFRISSEMEGAWRLASGVQLNRLFLALDRNDKQYSGEIKGRLSIFDRQLEVEGAYGGPGSGWVFKGETGPGKIPLGSLVNDLVYGFGIEYENGTDLRIPAPLKSLELKDLKAEFRTRSRDFSFSGAADFVIADRPFEIESTVEIAHRRDGKADKVFSGTLTLGSAHPKQFSLAFSEKEDNKWWVGAYHAMNASPTNISDLAHQLLGLSLPAGLEVSLQDAVIGYDTAQKKMFLVAHMGAGIHLSHLPLIGKMFPKDKEISLKYRIEAAKSTVTQAELREIRELLPDAFSSLADHDIAAGLNLSTQMNLAGEEVTLNLPIGLDAQSQGEDEVEHQPNLPAENEHNIRWFKVQKHLGPVYFSKVGMQYNERELSFLLDASLNMAGLTITLDGLSANSPLTHHDVTFSLKGLGIDYKNKAMEIGGAFIREHIDVPGSAGYDEYDGQAVVRIGKVSLGAIGSYARFKGHPSLFVYTALNTPLGGPAFFFVQGLSMGFGYNRRLNMPTLDELVDFPLVNEALQGTSIAAGAGKKELTSELEKIHTAIPVALHQHFLAAGIRFSSFKLIDTTLLAAASFGSRFELDLMGVSQLTVPPMPGNNNGKSSLASVQMNFIGSFIPEEGFAGLQGKLAPSSHILSRNCHLEGGFAFNTWFAKEHAGDFVATIGGYHPHFAVPAHYPKVPRLGIRWKLDAHTSLKGSGYFALCAHALMAGGHLQANFQKGALSAWFNLGLDFLLEWQPYHYEANAHVQIGGAYTYHAFGTHHISVDVGADVEIWGPDFGGHAKIDLSICSVNVDFGADRPSRPAVLNWTAFEQAFLPVKQANSTTGLCSVSVQSGLRQKGVSDDHLGAVNPASFLLVTDAFIPAKKMKWKGAHVTGITQAKFGIPSMDIKSSELESVQVVRVELESSPGHWQDASDQFIGKVVQKNYPAGIWGEQSRPQVNGKRFVENGIAGLELSPNLGMELSGGIRLEHEEYRFDTPTRTNAFRWELPQNFSATDLGDENNRHRISNSLIGKASARANMLQALGISSPVDLPGDIGEHFVIAPQIQIV